MEALAFLKASGRSQPLPLYVVHGEEEFLHRQVILRIRTLVLGEGADNFALSIHPGETAEYAAVMDEVRTVPFFGERRLVIVEGADDFVTKNRSALEKAVAGLPETATLVLDVKTWLPTTRLAKMVPDAATIACKPMSSAKLPAWCVEWAKARHGKHLTADAARILVDLVGTEMGLLDQEIEKLAVYVGDRARIGEEDVDRLVGRSQTEKAWKVLEAAAASNARAALETLGQLLDQGDEPLKIVNSLGIHLRRLAQGGRLAQQGVPLPAALEQAGIGPFFVKNAQEQLKHFGRERVNQLYDWLLELHMDLRGNSPLPPRILLERFVIRLARPQRGLSRARSAVSVQSRARSAAE